MVSTAHPIGSIQFYKELTSSFGLYKNACDAAAALPIIIPEYTEGLLKRSLMYSPLLAIYGKDVVSDEWWGAPEIPQEYYDYYETYRQLISKKILYVIPPGYTYICSQEREESDSFLYSEIGKAAIVSSSVPASSHPAPVPVLMKGFLPVAERAPLPELLKLISDEEIFSEYQDALTRTNFGNFDLSNEAKLRNLITEVDEKTRELNSKFLALKKDRRWIATKAVFGLSLAGFAYSMPGELSSYLQSVIGTVSAIAVADGLVGAVKSRQILESSPYYFSYKIQALNAESTEPSDLAVSFNLRNR